MNDAAMPDHECRVSLKIHSRSAESPWGPRGRGRGRRRGRGGFIRVWAQVVIALCGVATIGLKLSPLMQEDAAPVPVPAPGSTPATAGDPLDTVMMATPPGNAAASDPAVEALNRRGRSTFAPVLVRYVEPESTTTLAMNVTDSERTAPEPRTLGPTDRPEDRPVVTATGTVVVDPPTTPDEAEADRNAAARRAVELAEVTVKPDPGQPVEIAVVPPAVNPDSTEAEMVTVAGVEPVKPGELQGPPVMEEPTAPERVAVTQAGVAPEPTVGEGTVPKVTTQGVAVVTPPRPRLEFALAGAMDYTRDPSLPEPVIERVKPAPNEPMAEVAIGEPAREAAVEHWGVRTPIAPGVAVETTPETTETDRVLAARIPPVPPPPPVRPGTETSGPDPTEPAAERNPAEVSNPLGMTFSRIPAGAFLMGSPSNERDRESEETLHRVVISHDYYLGQTEVTQKQWERVMGTTMRQQRHLGDSGDDLNGIGDDHPMKFVTWFDAVEFCRRLGEADGRTYRLPTEAEWEYACRAGTRTAYHFGERLSPAVANFKGDVRRGRTVPVASFPPNALGLFDMHGNVFEWVSDRYDDEFYETDAARIDPTGPDEGDDHVLRGGSWEHDSDVARCASRTAEDPREMGHAIGFRVVLVAE